MDDPVYSPPECRVVHESVFARLDALEKLYIDHAQRFDTLQTPFWKRVWFWIDGWPWHDLNGTQRSRPWHRS